MKTRTLYTKELVNLISQKSGHPKKDVKNIMDTFHSTLEDILSTGGSVVITNLGAFKTVERDARNVHICSPKFGKPNKIRIDKRVAPVFKPARNLKKLVNRLSQSVINTAN